MSLTATFARPYTASPRGTAAAERRPPTPAEPVDAPTIAMPARPDGGSQATGLAVVVAVHVVIGCALVSGLAQKAVDGVRTPIEARLIEEIKPPPPPPPEPPKPVVKPVVRPKLAPPLPPAYVPPPEVQVALPPAAPTIAAVSSVAPPPAPIEPPAPPAPVVAAAPAPAAPVAIGVACPTMVRPVLPRRAEQDGIGGTVRAQATIRGGKVVAVQILSAKPVGVFDASVRNAMLQYGCEMHGADELVAVQTFEFKAAE